MRYVEYELRGVKLGLAQSWKAVFNNNLERSYLIPSNTYVSFFFFFWLWTWTSNGITLCSGLLYKNKFSFLPTSLLLLLLEVAKVVDGKLWSLPLHVFLFKSFKKNVICFQNGVLVKVTETCPPLNCSGKDHVLPENQCCSVCRGKPETMHA